MSQQQPPQSQQSPASQTATQQQASPQQQTAPQQAVPQQQPSSQQAVSQQQPAPQQVATQQQPVHQGTGQYGHTTTGAGGELVFHTRNPLPRDVRQATCQRLNQLLADTSTLRLAAKDAHWNVKGMHFYQFHELFEDLAEALAEQEDRIAERITALGQQAKGGVRKTASTTRISPIPRDTVTGRGFVQELAMRLAIHDANLDEDIRATEGFGDLDTTDLLNEISRETSQYLWFLEAHLQGPAEGQVWGGGQHQWAGSPGQ